MVLPMGPSSFPLKKFTEVMQVRGVGVCLHWSLVLVGCVILLGVIAWGGVSMQATVGLPLVVYLSVFGFTRFTPLNVAMGVLGYYSLFVAALNLLPIRPLDGAKAWYVVRVMFQKQESRAPKRSTGWRSYR